MAITLPEVHEMNIYDAQQVDVEGDSIDLLEYAPSFIPECATEMTGVALDGTVLRRTGPRGLITSYRYSVGNRYIEVFFTFTK